MSSRSRPRDIRASDADRELVLGMLRDAVADGRLTLDEHGERSERALTARTLGELTSLTADLTLPAGQPIRIYDGRAVTALFSRERRDGRWVVPDAFPVTAFFGDVTIDLRSAVLQSPRVVIYATAVAGQIRLIVPPGIAVEMVGRSFLGTRSVRGRNLGGPVNRPAAVSRAAPGPGETGVIEVRTLALGGSVKAITPRRSRWRSALRGR